MNRRFYTFYVWFVSMLAMCLISVSPAMASDWPQWRYDAQRGASSPEELPSELHLQWVRQYTPRAEVWDDPLNRDLMPYDRVFEPVVSGNMVVIGFNDADKVVALDLKNGKESWTAYLGGPVRFPPSIWNGRVYVTCDDGYLYCLDVKDGDIVWRFSGAPADRLILGNKRLISSWPARGGVVVEDGVAYFGASIWPFMGTFIYALDAETGEQLWVNDGNGSRFMKQPHNAPAFGGVAPQGAFALSGGHLLVPGGRSVPAGFDSRTGDFKYYELALNNKTGGSFVAAAEHVFFNHYRERETTMYHLETGIPIVQSAGEYPVIYGDTVYFSGESITAGSVAWVPDSLRVWRAGDIDLRKLTSRASKAMDANRLWTIDVDASEELIRAGSSLYAAGKGVITAVHIPEGGKPSVAWNTRVDGQVERLVAAQGHLVAVTLDGRIMVFSGNGKKQPKQYLDRPLPLSPSSDAQRQARALIEASGVSDGYAVVHGIGDNELVESLIVSSDLHIIVIDPDGKKAMRLRKRLDDAGVYGDRAEVVCGDPAALALPPYMASLTVYNGDSEPDGALLRRIAHSMRPYGGVAMFPSWTSVSLDTLRRGTGSLGVENLVLTESGTGVMLTREGPLPGAGTWTHAYGNIGNTAKSDDDRVRLPLGILWFGGNSNMDVLPRHAHGPSPQVVGGRLFIEGMNSMSARDVYTGRVIWKAQLDDLNTYGMYYDETYKDTPTETRYNQVHIPGANIRGANYVATADRVYVIEGTQCTVLDAGTGREKAGLKLPAEKNADGKEVLPEWAYIGISGDILVAGAGFVPYSDLQMKKKEEYSIWEDFDTSASKKVVVMDRFTGEPRWDIVARYGFLHNGTAAGNGMLYLLDKLPPHVEAQLSRRGKTPTGDYRLIACSLKTGDIAWSNAEPVFGSFLSYSADHDILLQATRPSRDMVAGEKGERMAAFDASTGEVLWDRELAYPTFPIIHGDRIFTEGHVYDIMTGEPVERVHPLTLMKTDWTWNRQYGCNYPIASDHLLTFRSGAAGFYDLDTDGGTGNFGGFKSGCTANLIVADGVLNAPDYTRTCSCSYQNQTSLAMVYMPDNEMWTYNSLPDPAGRVNRIGVNFGAPGDRRTDDGTLWIDYPSVGGDSPDVPVSTMPETGIYYHHHSARYKGESPLWIAASGVEGLSSFTCTVDSAAVRSVPYTVRLYFAEPADIGKGSRVFDVYVQENKVLDNFDIVALTGSPRTVVVREFKSVPVRDALVIRLEQLEGSKNAPVISGVEIVCEETADTANAGAEWSVAARSGN